MARGKGKRGGGRGSGRRFAAQSAEEIEQRNERLAAFDAARQKRRAEAEEGSDDDDDGSVDSATREAQREAMLVGRRVADMSVEDEGGEDGEWVEKEYKPKGVEGIIEVENANRAPVKMTKLKDMESGGGNELDYALENKLQNKKTGKKKKRKKKRGRDSTDSTSGPRKKRGRGRPRLYESDSDDDMDALKPSNNVRKSNGYVRTIPEFTITHQTHTITTDANPNRICNPLLRLPQFPDGKDPSIIDIPQAGELWKLSDLHYYDGDTYPVSYLARVLGFDVKEDATNEEFGKEFDVGKIGKMMNESDGNDDSASLVPARGSFCDRVWKKQDGKTSTSSSTAVSARATTFEGLTDDLNLTYSDPLWANILSSYKGYNEDDFKDAGKGFEDDLSQLCLDYARERGVILKKEKIDKVESNDQKKSADKEEVYKNDRMRFRFATEKDEEMLSSLAEKVSYVCVYYLSFPLSFCLVIS